MSTYFLSVAIFTKIFFGTLPLNYIMEIKGTNSTNGPLEPPQVPYFYDKHPWKVGETYRMRVSHIFDLSKFWVVLLEEELSRFQEYIHNFYVTDRVQYKIESKMICREMYSVVFTEGSFYRAKIVDIPFMAGGVQRVTALLIDFGQVISVNINHVYYFHEKFHKVPCFATRACLSHIQPSNDKDRWSSKAILRFNELVCGKILLCLLESTDQVNKIINISIADVDQQLQVHDIGNILVKEKLAEVVASKKRKKWNKRLIPITKNPYLFPTFEAIEEGEVPSCAKSYNSLRKANLKQTKPNFSYLECYYYFDQYDQMHKK